LRLDETGGPLADGILFSLAGYEIVRQSDEGMMEERIRSMVTAELGRMPEPRRLKLLESSVDPYKVSRSHGYRDSSSECWIVAVAPTVLLAFCEDGLSTHYCWGILDPRGADLGGDDAWHATLDDAFINSGLCDPRLIPSGYEVP
jgi:hypothetical protein